MYQVLQLLIYRKSLSSRDVSAIKSFTTNQQKKHIYHVQLVWQPAGVVLDAFFLGLLSEMVALAYLFDILWDMAEATLQWSQKMKALPQLNHLLPSF